MSFSEFKILKMQYYYVLSRSQDKPLRLEILDIEGMFPDEELDPAFISSLLALCPLLTKLKTRRERVTREAGRYYEHRTGEWHSL